MNHRKVSGWLVRGIVLFICAWCLIALLAGCHSTSIITEYGPDGKVTKVTETNESALNAVVKSAAGKTLVVYEGGWIAFLEVTPGSTDNPTPHFTARAGNQNSVYASILPGQDKIAAIIPDIIRAAKSGGLSVGTKGITSTTEEKP